MKQLILSLVLFAACCGCSPGSKSAQSTTQSTTQSQSSTRLSVATTSLSGAVEGVAYSATLAAQGGTPPYTWWIASGQLPAGLTLAGATGVISGIPTGPGEFNIVVQVKDSAASPATAKVRARAKTH